jgi:hypothetical protein
MYGARSGKVVRRVSSLASPMLVSKAVVRALLAKLKSLCLVTPMRWRFTTAAVALAA